MKRTNLKRIFTCSIAVMFIATAGITVFAAKGDDQWGDPPDGFTFEAYSTGITVYATPPTSTNSSNTQPSGSDNVKTEQQISDFPQKVLELVNKEREALGLSALLLDESLTKAAQIRAKELEALYSHERLNGEKGKTVFDDAAVDLKYTGENIAWGQKDAEAVVTAWMNSPGHRDNILNEKAEYIGIAVHKKANGNLCWTQLFAKDK